MPRAETTGRSRVPTLVKAFGLAFTLNVLSWVAAASWPNAFGVWRWVALVGVFLIGFLIGRWWALVVTLTYGLVHAIPVYLGILPGYLSTWGEALWWLIALTLMVGLTALGVVARRVVRKLRHRPAARAA